MHRPFPLPFPPSLAAPPPVAVRFAAEVGYDFVGFRLLPASPGGIAFRLMEEPLLLRETRSAMDATGIRVLDVEIVRIGRDFSIEAYEPFLETSARLGARSILVAGDDPDEARTVASFAAFSEAAAPFGLSADLEFMPQSQVRDVRAALRILAAAGQPNAAVIVDA